MKNYFYRYLPKERDAKIVQYIIPYPMPLHMTSPFTTKQKEDLSVCVGSGTGSGMGVNVGVESLFKGTVSSMKELDVVRRVDEGKTISIRIIILTDIFLTVSGSFH